ncbi:unnamed protein product [Parnassius apollo]|uniref:(apollo) hypothetical protein n=1 Tax=Parnassius apollo TaxID=110799 RepID=A0A8S3WZJ4_PARAO|nr:unnamed protein product [Parnassius apollo]
MAEVKLRSRSELNVLAICHLHGALDTEVRYTKLIIKCEEHIKEKKGAKPRIRVDPQILKEAVNKVLEGNAIEGTAKEYNVPIMTLKKYARKQMDQKNEITYEPNYRQSQVFTKEEELHLAMYLEKASKLHHGLSSLCFRQLAYQLAIQNQKPD